MAWGKINLTNLDDNHWTYYNPKESLVNLTPETFFWIKSMSIKNQSRFTIFASLIVGVTILAFVGLNLIVDKISKINTSQVAQTEPRGPRLQGGAGGSSGADDEYKTGTNAPGQPNQGALPPGAKGGLPEPGAPTPMRRMNGKNGAEFEQKPAQPANQRPATVPTQQPDMRQSPPPGYQGGYPDPSKMSPEQREAFEVEMYRRQQLIQGQQPDYDYPPPEYYQGPGPYDRGYEDDYDYDPGYRGQKTDAKSSQVKISDSSPNHDYDEEDDDEYDPDDYLDEDLE